MIECIKCFKLVSIFLLVLNYGCMDEDLSFENAPTSFPQNPKKYFDVDINGSINMEMIWVSAGSFNMGSPTSEIGRQKGKEKLHKVTISRGFYLGKYEVTQLQYKAVMKELKAHKIISPSHFKGQNLPVEKVSWHDVQIFLDLLNKYALEKKTIPFGWKFCLPSESEWEYACRAGTQTIYSWGNRIWETDTNGASSSGIKRTKNVGSFDPNPWGFYDMHGNVREWVNDWYSEIYPDQQTHDPVGPMEGIYRVSRGGSWHDPPSILRSADRQYGPPNTRYNALGFRVCLKQIEN